jgi:hypothetical protein
MKLYSTKDKTHIVELKEAVLRGLPPTMAYTCLNTSRHYRRASSTTYLT